jgi:hypothetical protein
MAYVRSVRVGSFERAKLVQQSAKRPELRANPSLLLAHGFRVAPMLEWTHSGPLSAFGCLRTGAQTTVNPATPISHRRTLAERAAPRPGAATGRFQEITRWIPVFQPSASRSMGSLRDFLPHALCHSDTPHRLSQWTAVHIACYHSLAYNPRNLDFVPVLKEKSKA